MGANLILYDRLWLSEYIGRLSYQRGLARFMEECLQREKARALPQMQISYESILSQIRELNQSLEIMETTLKEYLENVQSAAFRLQRQCQDLQLPEFVIIK